MVGLDKSKKEAVIGECKFKKEVTDKKVYDSLAERYGLLRQGYRVTGLLIFSAGEFSSWLQEEEKKAG